MGPVLANNGIGTGTTTAPVTAKDTTAPVVTPPANITVEAEGLGGTPAANLAIAAFLAGATALDAVDGSLAVANDAPAEFPFGVTTVTFFATDAVGNTGTAHATVTVQDTTAPTVSITNPPEGAIVSGSAVLIAAEAADAGSGVALVEFSIDGGPFSPLAFNGIIGKYEEPSWNTENLTEGPHTIDVRATDAAGNTGVASRVSVTVNNTGPIIISLMASPDPFSPNGDGVNETTTISATLDDGDTSWTINITASDGSPVLSVSFFGTPISSTWDGKNGAGEVMADGAYTITVEATDAAGNSSAASTAVTVDNTAPAVLIISPVDGSTVLGPAVAMLVAATDTNDPAGTLTVEMSIEDAGFAAPITLTFAGGLYGNHWDTTAAADGPHTIYARAIDAAGNTSDAVQVSVMVDNTGPTITITSPVAGSNVSGTISVTADATSDVAQVEFFVDGVSIGADATAPYAVSWDSTTVADGLRNVTATVTDTIGQTASDSVSVTVDNDANAPTLALVKTVINDNGGELSVSDFTLRIDGSPVTSGAANPVSAGAHTATEDDPSPGYVASVWGGDCAADGSITLALGDVKTCTITNDDVAANLPTLTVIKTVVNDDGGSAAASDWTMDLTGSNVSSTSFAGSETGVTITLDAGTYSVSESGGPSGYSMSFSTDCSGTISAGDVLTCTITNNDIAPKLTVTKIVVNDDGGTKAVGDFPLFVDGNPVISGVQNTLLAGTHTAREDDPSPGYAVSAWGGDCAADGTITLAPGNVKTCTITNNDVGATLTVTVIRHKGRPVTETFSVSKDMNAITVMNGTTGLKNLRIEVNGRKFQVAGLKDGEKRTLDISSAMIEKDNAITLTALGKPGTKATVKIWDGGG